jgi:threonyl-tRNA synthetase
MVNITLPDSTKKIFENNPTGFDIAKSISEGFARNCVAMEINGEPLSI